MAMRRRHLRRLVIDLVHQPEEGLVTIVERRRFHVAHDAFDERVITEQLRRNCGV